MTLYLVRHPATVWTGVRYVGRRDLDWSAAGRRRADELVAGLGGRLRPTAVVITSPLRRAHGLARRLADRACCALEVDERWTEVDVGALEGATFAELEARDPLLARRLAAGDLGIDWPAGERFAELEARVIAAYDDARLRLERPVVVVSHAGPIAVLLERFGPSGGVRFIGPGDALAVSETGTGTWSVRPAGIPTR